MDKNQYFAITAIMQNDELDETAKLSEINQILGIDVNDPNAVKAIKEKIIGNDTILVKEVDGQTTVSFGGFEASAATFGSAFLAVLLNAIGARAIDKFLPEPKVEKKIEGGKRDGNGSPAPSRSLPIKGNNY